MGVFFVGVWRIIEGGFRFYDLFASIFYLIACPLCVLLFNSCFTYSKYINKTAHSPKEERSFYISLLTVLCTDVHGNTIRESVSQGVATFENLKPNTQYKLIVHYKIAPNAAFEYEESDNTHKMSGYLFARGLGENGEGSANGDINGKELASIYLLHGSKNEWRTNDATFRTNDRGLLCLDLRAVQFAGTAVHYYIDYIQIYEVL